MRITIDTDTQELVFENHKVCEKYPLYSRRSFELISKQWLKVGWNEKYPYTFSWFGRPIIQLPEDMIRIQEVLYAVRPTLIIETGVAHGGSLIYYASVLKGMGIANRRVVGIDIEIRRHNRAAIESHELFPCITLLEGSSVSPEIISSVASLINRDDKVLVILDSNHTKTHVAAELDAYHGFVSSSSYIVATDGSMRDLHDVPRGDPTWTDDHPVAAVEDFIKTHPQFSLEQPAWPFNESELVHNITHWPNAYLRRVK